MRHLILMILGVLSVLGPRTAHALDGLEWSWDAQEERRYLLQANVRFAEFYFVNRQLNSNLRLVEVYGAAVVRCQNADDKPAKRSVYLNCTFEDVQFKGAPPKQDSGKGLPGILDEWDQMLLDARADVELGTDGKLRSLSLEGIDTRIRRFREIREQVRLVLARMFAGMELQLPRKGNDKGKAWDSNAGYAAQLPSQVGSFGNVKIRTEVVARAGDVAQIRRKGDGITTSGETLQVAGGQERPRNTFKMHMEGVAKFDVSDGSLVEQDYVMSGEPTASSQLANGTPGSLYLQSVHVERIPGNAKVAPLGPNEESKPGTNGI